MHVTKMGYHGSMECPVPQIGDLNNVISNFLLLRLCPVLQMSNVQYLGTVLHHYHWELNLQHVSPDP